MVTNKLIYEVIKTRSGQTGYVTLGSGKPLILLVGYSGTLLHWNSQLIYKLAEKFTLYLPDNRLVGKTVSTNSDSISGLAEDCIDFIEALNLSKPLLCGWSMGGIIAQALAYLNPELISGIVLIVSQPDYSFTLKRLHKLVSELRIKPTRENRDRLSELFFSSMPTIEFRKYLAKSVLPIMHYVYPFNAAAEALQIKAVTNWHSNMESLAKFSFPVLITTARNDQVTSPKASYVLHEVLKNSKLISYPDGGHFFSTSLDLLHNPKLI